MQAKDKRAQNVIPAKAGIPSCFVDGANGRGFCVKRGMTQGSLFVGMLPKRYLRTFVYFRAFRGFNPLTTKTTKSTKISQIHYFWRYAVIPAKAGIPRNWQGIPRQARNDAGVAFRWNVAKTIPFALSCIFVLFVVLIF
ncbi:MAG: hypothetical protein LBE35_02475 [Clostridiales bacterium]|jgi:hypothetical protein|nr:hypothetical protein [Clostridiales bacterium]